MLHTVKLTANFHSKNVGLIQALHDKGRGYGVVKIEINNLIFGIPLRTNLSPRNGVVLDEIFKNGKKYTRGLDFSKAVLIRDEDQEVGDVYLVDEQQRKKLISKEKMIINKFNKYVTQYVTAAKNNKTNTLGSYQYKFCTLVNYHVELGIESTESDEENSYF